MPRIKRILKGDEARLKAKEGIDLVADIVKITLGPKGRNNLLTDMSPVPPRIVNDGVTIAKHIEHEDVFVNAGVRLTKHICDKTNDNAGDGTTTTALLAQAIVGEGYKRLLAGENAVDIRRSLEEESFKIIDNLTKLSHDVKTKDDIKHIAGIAANNDDDVGEKISEIFNKVGKNASILVEKSNDSKLRVETIKGMYFDKGFEDRKAFVNSPHMKGIFNDALICVSDKKLNWIEDIESFMGKVIEQGLDKLVIIADEIEGQALTSLALTNKAILQGGNGLHVIALEAPEYGPTRDEILEDICVFTGAKLISDKTGLDFNTCEPKEVLGGCEKIVIDSKSTTIIGGTGKKSAIKGQIQAIKAQIDQCKPNEKITREKLEKRLSIMEAGVGIIYAGGPTEVESKERGLRLEDAILATKSAIKSGYVEGGGMTYLKLSDKCDNHILKEALLMPLKQVAINAGKNPDTILDKVRESKKGWNAQTDEYGDLIKLGIIDATLVVENAIRNAISLAAYFLTTENL